MIGRLWTGLKERSMEDKINIILVGDHGIVLTYSNGNMLLDENCDLKVDAKHLKNHMDKWKLNVCADKSKYG